MLLTHELMRCTSLHMHMIMRCNSLHMHMIMRCNSLHMHMIMRSSSLHRHMSMRLSIMLLSTHKQENEKLPSTYTYVYGVCKHMLSSCPYVLCRKHVALLAHICANANDSNTMHIISAHSSSLKVNPFKPY